MSRVLCLIQARVNSSRLPRKSLAIIGARASVFHVWKRALNAGGAAWVVVPEDDEGDFRAVLPEHAVLALPGDEADVLGRLAEAVEHCNWSPDIIVRLTADCPFVDPEGIRAVVKAVEDGVGYATLEPIPNGLDVEAFRYELLMLAHKHATDPADREHVTPWMRRHGRYGWASVAPRQHLPRYRWTLDHESDLMWFREVAKEVDCTPPHPTVPELLALMERRPDLVRTEDADGSLNESHWRERQEVQAFLQRL